MTWVPGEPGIAAADAFLAAARYAALDGPELTAAQLHLLRGAALSEAARFDVAVPIESAIASFTAAFPAGQCATRTDPAAKGTELSCSVEVDHPVFAEVRFAWPSAPKARVRSVTLTRQRRPDAEGRAPPDPTGCLTAALGSGEKEVVDFASGRAVHSWRLGKGGDRAVLDGDTFTLAARAGADPAKPADFTAEHAKILGSLASCSP